MKNFFISIKFKISLAIFAALLFGISVAAVSNSGTSPLSSALGFIISPLHNVAVAIADTLDDFNGYFVSSKAYADKIEELESENAELRSELIDYEKTIHKLEAYEDFLEVKEDNPDFSFTPAEIILRDQSDFYGTFTLNKGASDGISVNDPVIYSNVLIGVVKEVTENSSIVYTLFHPDVSVSSYEIRTRESCYTEAESAVSKTGYIKLCGLTKSTPIVSGGTVCTSGIGGIYPKDLIIGTVKEIKTDETGIGVYALLLPEADYSVLTDVFIITDFEGKTK